mmetsp:Transcript_33247/g.33734  ORF Transcript_33247/g.33734 Transcript_33247/m.33734 type:complete len:387 (+) Transcript_33247:258-1418(+)
MKPTKLCGSRLAELPPSISGIGLGSVGLAGALRLAGSLYALPFLTTMAIPLFLLSSFYIAVSMLRSLCHPIMCSNELAQASTASGYGALAMALCLLFAALAKQQWHNNQLIYLIGTIGVYFGSVIQVVSMVLFFKACWIHKNLPEPFWFPPTVSFAIIGWNGVVIGMPRILVELSFWGGVLVTIVVLPVAAFRTVWYPHQVATNPSVAILQAPASFVTVAWFNIQGSHWLSFESNDILISVLFAASTVAFLLTLICILRRCRYICGVGFSHAWASFTFPSMSTTIAALFFAQYKTNDQDTLIGQASMVWATILAVTLLPTILGIILWYTFLLLFRVKALVLVDSLEKDQHSSSLELSVNDTGTTNDTTKTDDLQEDDYAEYINDIE